MNKKPVLKAIRLSCATLILSLSLIGCSLPLNHIGAFSQASANLAKIAADAYNDVNETTIERRISDIASDPELSPNDPTFEMLIADEALALRLSLLRGVKDYAEALGNLASADFRKEIDEASKDLYGALGKLQDTYADKTHSSLISDDNLAIIATAVDAIGTAIVENKRRDALKTIIIQSDPLIRESMKLISGELPLLDITVENLNSIYTDKISSYKQQVETLSYTQRVEMLRDIRRSYQLYQNSLILLTKLAPASKAISDAHTALREAVETNKFTTNQLIKEIKNLVEISKSIKKYHDGLLEAEKS